MSSELRFWDRKELMRSVYMTFKNKKTGKRILKGYFRLFGISWFGEQDDVVMYLFGKQSPEIRTASQKNLKAFGWDKSDETTLYALKYLIGMTSVIEKQSSRSWSRLIESNTHRVLLRHMEILCIKANWRLPILPDIKEIRSPKQVKEFAKSAREAMENAIKEVKCKTMQFASEWCLCVDHNLTRAGQD